MAKRPCLDCRTPSEATRCPDCTRTKDRARGSRQDRGYDRDYDRTRAEWQRRIDSGERVCCWRCDTPVTGRAWHLGHDDHDRSVIRGPECEPCNLRAAGLASHGISPAD